MPVSFCSTDDVYKFLSFLFTTRVLHYVVISRLLVSIRTLYKTFPFNFFLTSVMARILRINLFCLVLQGEVANIGQDLMSEQPVRYAQYIQLMSLLRISLNVILRELYVAEKQINVLGCFRCMQQAVAKQKS